MATGKTKQISRSLLIGKGAAVTLIIIVAFVVGSLIIPVSYVEIRPDSGKFEIDPCPSETQGSAAIDLVFKTEQAAYRYEEGTVKWFTIADDQPEYLTEKYGYFGNRLWVEAYVHASRRTC